MSFWRSLGGGIRRLSPLAALIPGVGPLAAAGIGAFGAGLESNFRGRDMVGGAAQGGAGGWGAQQIGGRVAGLGSLLGGGEGGEGGGGIGGLLRGIGGFAANNPGLLLGGASMLQGARSQDRSNDMMNQMLGFYQQEYGDREPLRQTALANLTGPMPERQDLSSVFASSGNPYERPLNFSGTAPGPFDPRPPGSPGDPVPGNSPDSNMFLKPGSL